MITDNIGKLLTGIIIVLLLLGCCVSVDYANDTISNVNNSTIMMTELDNVTLNDSYILPEGSGEAKSDGKIYTVKKTVKKSKKPIITVYGYPTCYTCWRTEKYRKVKRSYINYCPNCKKYNTLHNNPKKVKDGEITCSRCDCDFCDYCGRDKVGSGGRHNWNILKKA